TSPRAIYEVREAVATLGRAPSNTVVLTDYHLSGEHGQIVREGGGYVYRDLRSTNGSAIERGGARIPVDGSRRFQIGLEHGDLLLVGDPKKPVTVRVRVLRPSITGEIPGVSPPDLGDRLIASRSIVDLPAVADQIEHDPVNALRVYKALQRLSGRLD